MIYSGSGSYPKSMACQKCPYIPNGPEARLSKRRKKKCKFSIFVDQNPGSGSETVLLTVQVSVKKPVSGRIIPDPDPTREERVL
jgi:hypothetical protein